MSSRHLVDPELLGALYAFPQFDFSTETLAPVRQGFAAMLGLREIPDDPDLLTEEHVVIGPEGNSIGLFVYRPKKRAVRPVILHIHGGGYIIGAAAMSALSNSQIALEMDCVVASVDYRLAPETPHPGPVEDCYAALKWLHDNAEELGVDRGRIVVAGESAGGGLAAALALLARDRGEIALCHQHLTYPMLDDRTCVRDAHPYTGEFVWSAKSNRFGWTSLLGCAPGGEGISPYAAAARATDLAGLPSTFIAVGSLDLFLVENMDYAARLTCAGVPTEFHVHPGAFHGFEVAQDADVTRRAKSISDAALRRALCSPIPPPPAPAPD